VEQWKKGGKEKRSKGVTKEITIEVGKSSSKVDSQACNQGHKTFHHEEGANPREEE